MSRRIARRPPAWLAVLALSTVALAACGSSNDNKTSSSSSVPVQASKDATIAAQVPAAIKSKGTLTVAADATYPPNEFIKPGTQDRRRDGRRPRQGARSGDGPERQGRQRELRQHPARARGEEVRPRHVVLHRHPGAREDRRLRRPTSRPERRSTPRSRVAARSPAAWPALDKAAVECGPSFGRSNSSRTSAADRKQIVRFFCLTANVATQMRISRSCPNGNP